MIIASARSGLEHSLSLPSAKPGTAALSGLLGACDPAAALSFELKKLEAVG
jgi:hypothetical protein